MGRKVRIIAVENGRLRLPQRIPDKKENPMFDFADRVVVITGAAGNLGRATTLAFHAAGARVAVVDRKREIAVDVFEDLIPEGDYCLYVAADLMQADSVAEAVQTIVDKFGRIDVLVNIAGGFTMGPPVHETPLETWEFMLNLNARTAFLMSRAVIPHMLVQEAGKIVSVAARAALEGKAHMAPYVVSKAAVVRLTESMAAELKDKGINVNCILPGTIDTPQNRKEAPNADFSKWVAPEALADVILFLASDAARAVQGAAVGVYGRG